MPVPSPRNSIRIARGNFSDLDANKTAFGEGEFIYAIDQDRFYTYDSGLLAPVGVGTVGLAGIDKLSDVDTTTVSPGVGQVLKWDGSNWAPADDINTDAVTSVNTQTGDVVLGAADVGAATAAQGALADSAVQPTDSVGVLSDVDITTTAPTDGQALIWDNAGGKFVPGNAGLVDSVNGQTGDVVLDTDDISEGSSNLYSQWDNATGGINYASGNVGIGASSPGRELHVVGANNVIRAESTGTAARIEFEDSNTTAVGAVSLGSVTDDMQFVAGSAERLRIDSDGNVGIGTSSPDFLLDVQGAGNQFIRSLTTDTSGTAVGVLRAEYTGGGGGANSNVEIRAGDGYSYILNTTSNPMLFGISSTERMRIDSSGNVGIGTSNPGRNLVVERDGAALVSVRAANTQPAAIFFGDPEDDDIGQVRYENSTNEMLFRVNAAEAMRISSSGNLGIGTSSPDSRLHIQSGQAGKLLLTNSDFASGTTGTSFDVRFGTTTGNTYTEIRSLTEGRSTWSDLVLQRGGGNVGIGTSDPGASLEVSENGATDGILLKLNNVVNAAGAEAGLSILQNSTDQLRCNLLTDRAGTNAGVDLKVELSDSVGTIQERFRITEDGNVGIGTSNPGAGLHIVSGGQTVSNISTSSNINALITDNGSSVGSGGSLVFGAAEGAWRFAAIKGLVSNGTDNTTGDIAFSTRRGTTDSTLTESMRIASNGNVGIGTSSPGAKLEVVSSNSNTDETVAAFGNQTILGGLEVITNGNLDWGFNAKNSRNLVFETNQNERVRIDSSGNVGIGTSDPSSKLHLADTFTALTFEDTDSTNNSTNVIQSYEGTMIFHVDPNNNSTSGETMRFSMLGSEVMRIDSSGKVGIGTSSPIERLTVKSGLTDGTAALFQGFEDFRGLEINLSNEGGITDSLVNFNNKLSSGRLTWSLDGSEKMRIDSSGRVLVGTATELGNGGLTIRPSQAAGSAQLVFTRASNVSTSFCQIFNSNGADVGSISYTDSGTAFNTSSDYRLKENVVPMTGAAERVKALKPSRFNFIAEPDITVDGFLAHEAQEIVPEAVTGEKDGEEMQAIDQSKLVPLLAGALQEALAKIEALEQRLNDAGL